MAPLLTSPAPPIKAMMILRDRTLFETIAANLMTSDPCQILSVEIDG